MQALACMYHHWKIFLFRLRFGSPETLMKRLSCILFLFASIFWTVNATGQEKSYSTANGHAHNDYLNPRPFYLAYESGFGSIEADIFNVGGKLLVAHTRDEIKQENTLTRLYIAPLLKELEDGNSYQVILLIDIKQDHRNCLRLLISELEPLQPYLAKPGERQPVTVVISGERPLPEEYKNYPDFIFFDSDLKQPHSAVEWQRVALVSLPFNKLSNWKGDREPATDELLPVKSIIDSVHRAGKPIRFWAAPDNLLSWKWQKKLSVDLIGTDRIRELGEFLKNESN